MPQARRPGWILSAHKPAEKAAKATGDSKLKIRFMTEAEVMEYLISTKMELKFNSQICTTIEQSKKLLKLGLKPETADMYHTTYYDANDNNNSARYTCVRHRRLPLLSQDIPAWSLHRLLCMLDKDDTQTFDIMPNLAYEDVIATIELRINSLTFNKEYLNK